MKTTKYLFVTILSIMLLSPVLTLAQTLSNNKNTLQEKISEEMKQKKENATNSIETKTQNITYKVKERANQFMQIIKLRFDAAVNRLDGLASRIESRIEKMKAENINTKEAEALLVTTKEKIETAKESISLITVSTKEFASTTASTTIDSIKEAFVTTKNQIENAKQSLKEAQAALVDVVNSLKPGDNKMKQASTTPTPE